MNIVDIVLGRDSAYSTRTETLRECEWKAVVRIDEGAMYPTEKLVPADISRAMAVAAYDTLVASGFFSPPSFQSETVEAVEVPASPPLASVYAVEMPL